MKTKKLNFKDGAIAFLVAFLLSQMLIFAGQLIISGILALFKYSQAEMNEFFRGAFGSLLTQFFQFTSFVSIFIYYYKKTTLKEDCKATKTNPKLLIFFLVLGIVTMFALSYLINYFSLLLNLLNKPTITIGYDISKTSNYLLSIISLAILPAIGEELMFRGVIFNCFKTKNKIVPIILSSLLFTMFHFNLSQLIYPFLYGIILAIIYSYTNNIIVPISVHFLNNFLNITIQHFVKSSSTTFGNHILILTIVGAIIFLAIVAILLFMLSKKEKQETKLATTSVENEQNIELSASSNETATTTCQTVEKHQSKKQNTKHNNSKQNNKFVLRKYWNSAKTFMKNDVIVTIFIFAVMLAFYIGIAF